MFKLTRGYYIRKLDSKNWILAKKVVIETGKNKGNEVEKVVGYHSELEGAWNDAIDTLSLQAKDYKDLCSIVKDLKALKK